MYYVYTMVFEMNRYISIYLYMYIYFFSLIKNISGVYATKTRMMIKDVAIYAKATTKYIKDSENTKPGIKETVAKLITMVCKRLKLQQE